MHGFMVYHRKIPQDSLFIAGKSLLFHGFPVYCREIPQSPVSPRIPARIPCLLQGLIQRKRTAVREKANICKYVDYEYE